MVAVSYSQTLEIVWQKQLKGRDIFVAISRDNRFCLIQEVHDEVGKLILWDIESDKVIDSLRYDGEISCGCFSSLNQCIIVGNRTVREFAYLGLNPLRVLKRKQLNFNETPQNAVFTNTSYKKAWLGFESKNGSNFYLQISGETQYYDWERDSVLKSYSGSPMTLQAFPDGNSVLTNSYYYYESYAGPTRSKTESSTIVIYNDYSKKELLYNSIITPYLTFRGNYIITQDRYIDTSSTITSTIQPRLSNVYTSLPMSYCIIEYENDSVYLRYIDALDTRKFLRRIVNCTKILPGTKDNFIVLQSKDNMIHVCTLINIKPSDSVYPKIEFSADKLKTIPNSTVNFTNESIPIEPPYNVIWDFGDGVTSKLNRPSHTYNKPGKYAVTLMITDNKKREYVVKKDRYIEVLGLDENIRKQRKISNIGFSTIQYSADGNKLSINNLPVVDNYYDKHSTYIIDAQSLMKLDSLKGENQTMYPIQYKGMSCYVILKEKKSIIGQFGDDVVYQIRCQIKRSPSVMYSLYEQDITIPIPKVGYIISLGRYSLNAQIISDSMLLVKFSAMIYHTPTDTKSIQISSDTLIRLGNEANNKYMYLKAYSTDTCEIIDSQFLFTPTGIRNPYSNTYLKRWKFEGIRAIRAVSDDRYLLLTSDNYVPVIMCNRTGDTLYTFKSIYFPQTCLDVHPKNLTEFATADSRGNVTVWRVPPIYDTKKTLKLIDFYIQKSIDTVTLNIIVTPDLTIKNIEWDFGDGSRSTEITPTHTYKTAGTYHIILHCKLNDSTVVISHSVTVRFSPDIIDFYADDTVQNMYVKIQFTNAVFPLSPHFSYKWDFGDGTQSQELYPSHMYTSEGYYRVGLTVSRPGLEDTVLNKYGYIQIKPIIKFRLNKEIPKQISVGDTLYIDSDIESPSSEDIRITWTLNSGYTFLSRKKGVYIIDTNYDLLGSAKIAVSVRSNNLEFYRTINSEITPKIRLADTDILLKQDDEYVFRIDKVYPLNKEYEITWDWGDNSYSIDSLESTHSYRTTGNYLIIVTAIDKRSGTAGKDTVKVTVIHGSNTDFVMPTISNGESILLKTYTPKGAVYIYSLTGTKVRHWEFTSENFYEVRWILDDDKGNRVAPGMYYVVFRKETNEQKVIPVMILY